MVTPMPQLLQTYTDEPLSQQQMQSIADGMLAAQDYVSKKCAGLSGEIAIACREKFHQRFVLWERLEAFGESVLILAYFAVPLLLALAAVYFYRSYVENWFVNFVASLIKTRRQVGAKSDQIKSRIREKAKE